jgi:nicotinate-nucleotide adenylyltransferase
LATIAATERHVELVLIVGADTFALFDQWREPERIRELATIAVLARGDDPRPPAGEMEGVKFLRTRRVDISSTELRARAAKGRTIRGFVPDAVADYIAEHRLYK